MSLQKKKTQPEYKFTIRKRLPLAALLGFAYSFTFILFATIYYQIDTRLSTGKYIGSFSVILKASYHAPI